MTIEALRTPDSRFAAFPDWPYAPHYVEGLQGYAGLRAHYVDEGPKDGAHTFLCLHGEPSWAYLYRRMIPHFLGAGGRVVAPDFFGFGRSDKPIEDSVYTTEFHRDYLLHLIEHLDLQRITLVIQDWGGLLGLTLPLACPERFARLIIMNTAFGVGVAPSPGFIAWRDYAAKTPDMPVGSLIARGTPHLTPPEIAAYDAPFPDARYKAGVRRFPQLVPTEPDLPFAKLSREALVWWRDSWRGKSFMAVGAADPVLGPAVMDYMRSQIHDCPPALVIQDGGHFVQEWGDEIAKAALAAFSR